LKRLNDGKRSRLESDLEVSSQIVTVAQPKSFAGAFDQEQIDILQKALQRAWDVVSHTDDNPDHEALETLALCLIAEARSGERNFVKLVNRSIVQFRAVRIH
jgi:hypothetical protein